MKKAILTTIILSAGLSLFGQSLLDKPAAVIKLVETEIISSKKVNQNIGILETNAKRQLLEEEKLQVLNSMIDSALVVQAARRANLSIPMAQVKQYGITQVSQSVGRPLTEVEFNQIIEQNTNQPVDKYLGELEKQLLIQKYVSEMGRNDFQNIPEPSEREIEAAYKKEETTFINPEMLRISHIFFSFIADAATTPRLMNDSEKEEVRRRAETVLRSLKNGTVTFEQAVRTNSEDNASKGKAGDVGFLIRNDSQALQTFGATFVEQVYTMSVGEYELIESLRGYHIVRVTDQIEKKFLKLDDQVNPVEDMTVREYILQRLYVIKQQEVFQAVSIREVEKLRNEADITLYRNNLGW